MASKLITQELIDSSYKRVYNELLDPSFDFEFDEKWFDEDHKNNLHDKNYANYLKYSVFCFGRQVFKDISVDLYLGSIIIFFNLLPPPIDEALIEVIVNENLAAVKDYKNGNIKALNKIIGQVLKIQKSYNIEDVKTTIFKFIPK